MKYVRLVGAVIAGYACMAILITLVQETWFGGVGWYQSSLPVLAVAGFFTFLSAVAGAAVGTWLTGGAVVVGRVMILLVVTETTVMTVQGRLGGPLWFDLMAAASLVVGILIGMEAIRRQRRLRHAATVA